MAFESLTDKLSMVFKKIKGQARLTEANIDDMLRGARDMEDACDKNNFKESPAYMYAIIHYILMKQGKPMSVMMPYADSLKYMSDWYCQL